jgi:hypothetical protein
MCSCRPSVLLPRGAEGLVFYSLKLECHKSNYLCTKQIRIVLLGLVLYSFLMTPCSYQTYKYFHLHDTFSSYKMVSSPNIWYNNFNQDARSSNYKEAIQEANIYNRTLLLFCFVMGIFLMIWSLQQFHWLEQHTLKIDPDFFIAHPYHLLSKFLFKLRLLILFV